MKKYSILSLILTGTLFMSLCGCGNSNALGEAENSVNTKDGNGTTIEFWNSFTGSDGDVLREIVDRYNSENKDGITVKMDVMPSSSLSEKLPAAVATKTAPALVAISPADMVNYSNNDVLESVDDFFEATGVDKSNFSESSLNLFKHNDKQMLIPLQIQSTFFYWNKELFKEAGLDPEKPPTTWEEVAEYAGVLTDESKNQYGFGMPVSGAPTWFNAMFLSAGGSAVDLENRKSTLNSPENLEVLKEIQDLAVNKKVTPKGATGTDTDNLLYSGKLAMYVNGPWIINSLKESGIDYGISLMPSNTCILDGMGFGIMSGTPQEEKDAAYKFMAYWNTEEVCKEWSLRNGFPPYLNSLASDKEILSDSNLSTTVNMAETGKLWLPGLEESAKIDSDILFPMIEAIQSGQDCSEELKKASDAIDNLLK